MHTVLVLLLELTATLAIIIAMINNPTIEVFHNSNAHKVQITHCTNSPQEVTLRQTRLLAQFLRRYECT